jgi:hypothetical protein
MKNVKAAFLGMAACGIFFLWACGGRQDAAAKPQAGTARQAAAQGDVAGMYAGYAGPHGRQITLTYTDGSGKTESVSAFEGEIIVYVDAGITAQDAAKLARKHKGEILSQNQEAGCYLVKVPKGTEIKFMAAMRKERGVKYVQPNAPVTVS